MDLLNSTALYSKNVLNVLSSTISLIFLHMPCRINHFHHLITKSHEISGLEYAKKTVFFKYLQIEICKAFP